MEKNNQSINGLTLLEIKSTSIPVKELEIVKTNFEGFEKIISEKIKSPSFVVAYLDYKVLIGKFNSQFSFFNNESFELKYLQRIRVFNHNEELLLWRSEGLLRGRYRKDDPGNDEWAVEADQVLFGTLSKDLGNGYTEIAEDRGTKLTIPFINVNIATKENRMKIKTRNYITQNEMNAATYYDCRFVQFTFGKNNNPLEV